MINQVLHYEQTLQEARTRRETFSARSRFPPEHMMIASHRQEIESGAFWTSLVMFLAIAGPFLVARAAGYGGNWILWIGGIWAISVVAQGIKLAMGRRGEST